MTHSKVYIYIIDLIEKTYFIFWNKPSPLPPSSKIRNDPKLLLYTAAVEKSIF
jgi:hypothetical protein